MEINDIKQRLPITKLLAHYGIKMDKNNHIRCPFHDDDTPSCKIYPETNTYHCFACGKTGDVIQFIQDKEGCTKHEAILKAKSLIGKEIISTVAQKTMKDKVNFNELYPRFLESIEKSDKARTYCRERGLDHQQLKIGYNGGKLFNKLKHCIIFPLKDKEGNICSLYGRRAFDYHGKEKWNGSYNLEQGKHYYSENRSGLYPAYPTPETQTLILTEAIIDAATLLQIPEITSQFTILSCFGNMGFTKEIQKAVQHWLEGPPSHKATADKEVIIFFDGDQGGLDGINHITEIMQQIKPNVKVTAVATPEKEDVNSLFVKYGEDCLIQLINERKPCETILSQGKPVNETSFSFENPLPTEASAKVGLIEKEVQTHGRASHLLDTTNPNKIIYETQTARYIVKGGLPRQLDKMLISLDVQHLETAIKYRCRLDLYEEKQTRKEAREAAEKLDLRSDLIENDLSTLCDLLEEHREQELETSHREKSQVPPFNDVPAPRFRECQTFLMQPDVFGQLDKLMEEYGIIGEENNRKLGFCIVSSFNMPEPLHGIIIGTSGSGKTYLMVCECDLMPPERYMPITRATDNSFYHFEKHDLTHRLISLEDKDSMSFESNLSLREMQSRGVLRLSASGKNIEGNIHTYQKVVFGPIASLSCTTRGDGYDDDMNRCFIMSIDESPQQTAKIIEYQNSLSAGMHNKKRKDEIREFIRDLVRILKPYEVVNPYATSIHLPPEVKDPRRLNNLLRALIQQITLLHQYQRKKDAYGRLITTKEDVRLAITIMFDAIVLKADDLNGQLRKFFEKLKNHVKANAGDHYKDYTFRQKEIRMALMMSKTKINNSIRELAEMEYLQRNGGHPNDPGGQLYKIICWDNHEAFRHRIKTYLLKQLDNLTDQNGVVSNAVSL